MTKANPRLRLRGRAFSSKGKSWPSWIHIPGTSRDGGRPLHPRPWARSSRPCLSLSQGAGELCWDKLSVSLGFMIDLSIRVWYPFSNLGKIEKHLNCLLIKGNDNLLTFTEHFPCVMQTLCKVPYRYSHVTLGGKTARFYVYVALLKECNLQPDITPDIWIQFK